MRMSATKKVSANHSRPANTGSRCWSRALRNSSKRFHAGVSPLSPENAIMDQGRLAISTELSAANSHIGVLWRQRRSEEHTSELQSLMRISYAVFCLKNKKGTTLH